LDKNDSNPIVGSFMDRLLEAEPQKLVSLLLWLAALVSLVALAIYAIGRIRAKSAQQEHTSGELLSNFRELHSRGELSDEEFRTIRTTLAAQLQEELKDDDQTG